MSRAAQYIVIDDPNFFVGLGGDSTADNLQSSSSEFDFQVPFNCYLNRPSILTWMFDFKMNDNSSFLEMLINGSSVYNGTFVDNRYQQVQEVINPNILLWGKNTITVKVSSTASSWFTPILSDIVLWVEVNA